MPITGATRSEDPRRWRGGLARSTPRELRRGGQDRRRAPRVHSMHPCRRAWLAWRGRVHTLPRDLSLPRLKARDSRAASAEADNTRRPREVVLAPSVFAAEVVPT